MGYRREPYPRMGCGRLFLSVLFTAAVFIGGIKLGAYKPDILDNAEETIGRKLSDLKDSRPVIAIDAGHGGDDPGAQGYLDEAALTSATAEALYALLEADGRFQPVYCHTPGETASIQERYRAANKAYADLLICIHANSDPEGTGSGFECYPTPPGRKFHEESLRFGELLTEAFAETGIVIRGENGIRYAYYDDEDVKYIVESSNTLENTDASFGMLEKTHAPSVLAEQCFVTNESDVALLGSEDGCGRAADAYYRAICAFFTVDEEAAGETPVGENTETP